MIAMTNSKSSKKLLDYSTHRASTQRTTSYSSAATVPRRNARTRSARAMEEALTKTELVLGLPLDLPLHDHADRGSKGAADCKSSSRNSLDLSCSHRLRDSFQRRLKLDLDLESSEREQALLQSIDTSTSTASVHKPKPTSAYKQRKLLRSVSDPSHDVVPSFRLQAHTRINFALKKTQAQVSCGAMSSAFSHDLMEESSSTYRLRKSLLSMHKRASTGSTTLSSDMHSQSFHSMTIPEEEEMDISIHELMPDHRRRRTNNSLEDSFSTMSIQEEEEDDQEDEPSMLLTNAEARPLSQEERPAWVSRPKSVTDIATKMYGRYNSLALSLSGSTPPAVPRQHCSKQSSGSPSPLSLVAPEANRRSSLQHRHRSYQGLDLGANLLGSASMSSHSTTLAATSTTNPSPDVDLRSLLAQARQLSPKSQEKRRSSSSLKLDRLNDSMSSLLNASNSSLLSNSMHRRSSMSKLREEEQRNDRWWPMPIQKKNSNNITPTSASYQKPFLALPDGSKLALLASLNRSSSVGALTTATAPASSNTASLTTDALKALLNKTDQGSRRNTDSSRQGRPARDPLPSSERIAVPMDSSSSQSNSKQNFTWTPLAKNRDMAANPFLSIINSANSSANTNTKTIATNSAPKAPQQQLASTASNKRIKVLAPDGVTTLSRSSSFASTNDFNARMDVDAELSSEGWQQAPKKVTYERSPQKESPCSKNGGISSHRLYKLLLKNQRSKHSSIRTSASAVNLHQKSAQMGGTLSLNKLGAHIRQMPARRTSSRANLMSDSFAKDPSHFVTGSRIRRFQSAGRLPLF